MSRFQQLHGGDPEWATRRREGKRGERRGKDEGSSESDEEEDNGILQRTG